jgi:hypothetical protein
VAGVAERAVRAVDEHPHGVFAVDLREDEHGWPAPTEINAGRFPTTSPLYSELGANLCDMAARAAVGERLEVLGNDIYPEDATLIRHIDCGHVFTFSDVAVPA